MVRLTFNPKLNIPISRLQYYSIMIFYSLLYYLFDIDSLFSISNELLSIIIFAVSILILEVIIYLIFLSLDKFKSNKKGNI